MHPVVPFLLLLAIASDALGFLTLALFNPAADLHLVQGALDHGRRDRHRLRPAAGARQELLAVSHRGGRHLLAGVLLERTPSGAGAHADRAVPAARGARSRILRRRVADCQGRAEPVRDVVAVSRPGGAVLLRPRERRRAVQRARSGHLGPADRRDRRQAARHSRGGRRCRSPPACTCRSGSAGASSSWWASSPRSASASGCFSAPRCWLPVSCARKPAWASFCALRPRRSHLWPRDFCRSAGSPATDSRAAEREPDGTGRLFRRAASGVRLSSTHRR